MPRERGCLWHSKHPICATPMHHCTSQQSLFFKTSTITAGKHASTCSGKKTLTISRASAKYKACLLSSPQQEFKNEGDCCNHCQQDKDIDTDNTRSRDVTYLDARHKSIEVGQERCERQITSCISLLGTRKEGFSSPVDLYWVPTHRGDWEAGTAYGKVNINTSIDWTSVVMCSGGWQLIKPGVSRGSKYPAAPLECNVSQGGHTFYG